MNKNQPKNLKNKTVSKVTKNKTKKYNVSIGNV